MQNDQRQMPPLSDEEKFIIYGRGTEMPFSGIYCAFNQPGIYCCRNCGTALFRSTDKFSSNCGWPSFDDSITGTVCQTPDPDGKRMEISCAKCGGHLGHIFIGEAYTAKNVRYCVNSLALSFDPEKNKK